jgi:hypothetical protein
MRRHPLICALEQSIPAVQAASSLANVVPFSKRGRPLAKFEPITSTRSSKTEIPLPSTATEGSTGGWYGPKGVILDFPHADRRGRVTKEHKYRPNESERGLAVTDYAAIAYVVMAVTFYPALAWIYSS